MNLAYLVERLEELGRIKPSRVRSIRSSASRYAKALGYSSPGLCEEKKYARHAGERNALIEAKLHGVPPGVLRNIKSDVGYVLRNAEQLQLIAPISHPQDNETKAGRLGRRKQTKSLPSLIAAKNTTLYRPDKYSLPFELWSSALQAQYEEWRKYVSDAKQKALPHHRNRPATVQNKLRKFEAVFGYLGNVRKLSQIDFRMLIDVQVSGLQPTSLPSFVADRKQADVGLLTEYVQWHEQKRAGTKTTQLREVVNIASSVARRFFAPVAEQEGKHIEAQRYLAIAKEISLLRRKLEDALKLNSQDVFKSSPFVLHGSRVNYRDLMEVAIAEFPDSGRLPAGLSGTELASCAGRSVALLLMLHHPSRNRIYREMRLSEGMIKCIGGRWLLHFSHNAFHSLHGTFIKKKAKFEEFDLNDQVIGYLENYLRIWRPKLLCAIDKQIARLQTATPQSESLDKLQQLEDSKRLLFITSKGTVFSQINFAQWFEKAVYRWLGVRASPRAVHDLAVAEITRKAGGTTHIRRLRRCSLYDVEVRCEFTTLS